MGWGHEFARQRRREAGGELLSMNAPIPAGSTNGSCLSSDGTRIGYRQMGTGPGLVLLHGGMQSSRSFTSLGGALSQAFTIYIPDRRGRGLSGPFGDHYGVQTEIEDLCGLLGATGSRNVFALSSGALVALQCALTSPAIHKLALYEPPLEVGARPSPLDWVPCYEKALAAGNLPAAMVAILKGTGDRELLTSLPRFILEPMFKLAMRHQRQPGEDDEPSLQALIPTMHFDARLVAEMAGRLEIFAALRTETLLLGGSKSVAYLTAALDALSTVLPNCKRIEFAGLGHIAADNAGQPLRVADALRTYFA
jgi:pimeloyl-ACP methyl ester carboxylesterase